MGWLGLGNTVEALAELAQITEQKHPDVLEVRWALCASGEQWEEALKLARSIMAIALFRMAEPGLLVASSASGRSDASLAGAPSGIRQVPERAGDLL